MEYLVIRFLSALMAGMILSQTGSFIQLGTRNVLASPSTLGFDGLSIFWVLIFHSVLIFLNADQTYAVMFLFGLPFFLLIGWGFSFFFHYHKNINKLILVGLTFNLLVGGLFSLWQFFFLALNFPFPVELWFGHFRFSDFSSLGVLLGIEFLSLIGWKFFHRDLKIWSLGEAVARNFSIKLKPLYLYLYLSISVGTFAVVSLFGAFSFVGLIFPLIARRLWFRKFDLDGEMLLGGLINGLFLAILDTLCLNFPFYGAEIPVGLIVTVVGAVSLIFLLWKAESSFEMLAKKEK